MFNIFELRAMMIRHCDHYTVMMLSRANKSCRRTAEDEIRRRIRLVVSPFIGPSRFNHFLEMLNRTGAVVGGSVARRLLTINSIFLEDLDGKGFSLHAKT
jgi:hypothetical protein